MRKNSFSIATCVLAGLLAAGCGGRLSAVPSGVPNDGNADTAQSVDLQTGANVIRGCNEPVLIGYARCDSLIRIDTGRAGLSPQIITPNANGPYQPSDLHAAYKFSTTAGTGQTIAIVDAFNDPTAESDMTMYRRQFGLTPCTTANGCFKKVNQSGVQGSYPATDDGWASEISLDLDMVSAICQHCKILLVETINNSVANLAIGVDRAVAMGANVVSNSYGGPELFSSSNDYNHPGHILTASAGDNGTGPQQPCSFATVVCVGGTSLFRAANTRGFTETAWSKSGSGCSTKVLKPAWQTDTSGTHCTRRSEADVSAVADPNTGVIVYDTTPIPNAPRCAPPNCFWIFGGTSASAPIVAAAYGLAANASLQTAAKSIWTHPLSFFDVTSGSNGSCTIFYICHAVKGYDGPTGIGTPNGVGGL